MRTFTIARTRPSDKVGSRPIMVKSGQVERSGLIEFGFSNPDRPQLGVEVLDYARLRRRLSARTLATTHRTDFHELFLFTAGEGTTMVDFIRHPCTPGTLVLISPGRVLRLPCPTPADGAVEAITVLFTVSFPARLERIAPLLSPFGQVVWTIPTAERPGLLRALRELKSEYRRALAEADASSATIDLLRQLLAALLVRIARLPLTDQAGNRRGALHETFQRFQHELERSFTTTRNTSDYAARVGYSPRSLNRICQAATGRSAKALIDSRVALEAQRLLAHTDLPAAAIAHLLGFSEPTNFTKFFTRKTGESPGAFRDRERI